MLNELQLAFYDAGIRDESDVLRIAELVGKAGRFSIYRTIEPRQNAAGIDVFHEFCCHKGIIVKVKSV
jgi:hypothetical protein